MTALASTLLLLTLATTVLAVAAVTPSLLARGSASARHALLGATLAAVCVATAGVGAWRIAARGLTVRTDLTWTSTSTPPAEPDAPSSIQVLEPTLLERADATIVGSALGAWLAGATLLLARIVVGVIAITFARRRRAPIAEPVLHEALARSLERLRCRRRVALVWGDPRSVPATWGVLAPVVMLPPEAVAWDADRRDAVLLHELAHVARHDALAQLLRHLACALHWFNPVVWILAWRHQLEAELACDECVVRAGADPFDYAAHLVALARTYRTDPERPWIAVALARSASEVELRVRALVMRPPARRATDRLAMLGGVCLALGAALALAWWAHPETTRRRVAVTGLRGAPARVLRIRPGAVTTWRGAVGDGRWLEVLGGIGNVRVEWSPDTIAEVAAWPRAGASGADVLGMPAGVVVVRGPHGDVQVCVREIAEPRAPDCSSASAASDQPLDLVVRVPAGVRIAAHARRGDIDATSLRSQVWATTGVGRVTVSTSEVAEASADSGDVIARLGARAWTSDVEFTTGVGHVDVAVSGDVRAQAELVAERGAVHSDFALPVTHWRIPREAAVGPLAPGGAAPAGRLTLRAARGDVYLRRGAP